MRYLFSLLLVSLPLLSPTHIQAIGVCDPGDRENRTCTTSTGCIQGNKHRDCVKTAGIYLWGGWSKCEQPLMTCGGKCSDKCINGKICSGSTCITKPANDPGAPKVCPANLTWDKCSQFANVYGTGVPVTEKSNRAAECVNNQKCEYYRRECKIPTTPKDPVTGQQKYEWCLIDSEQQICKPEICSPTTTPSPTPCVESEVCNTACMNKSKCTGTVVGKGSCQGTNYACKVCTKVTCSPAPSATPSAVCNSLLAYTENWASLKASDMATYQAGDKFYLCVLGISNVGTFTKAQFTVNGSVRPEVTFKKPGTEYFCDLYTIPANTYDFKTSALIYNSELGWK